MEKRVKKIQQWLKENDADCFLVTSEYNRRYLSGFTGTFGYPLIGRSEAWFLTDSRYALQASKQCKGFKIVKLGSAELALAIKQLMDSREIDVLALEKEHISYGFYEKMVKQFGHRALILTSNVVEELRMIKDKEEIATIARAEEIGDMAFEHILSYIKPGVKEKDVALELEYFMKQQGASGISFNSIVASGYRSEMPHGVASDKVIETGDLVTLDFGCIYEGYCSDMTRTIGVGRITDEQRVAYDTVLQAQNAAIEAIHAGVIGNEIDGVARKVLREKGLEGYFEHGLGHSLGLEIHEEPRFSRSDKNIIKANMVLSVEPGVYLRGFGVRIEDIVVVEENGCKNLTKSPKELIIL